MLTSSQKEQSLQHIVKKFAVSHTKACKIISCSRTKLYYDKKMPGKDIFVKQAIESVMGSTRKGRNKIIRLVQKNHPQIGASKIRRVYEKSGFSLSKKWRRRMKDNPANSISIPLAANEEWAMDFMCDVLGEGRQIRTLNIIDHFNRQCMGITVDFSLPSRKVIEALDRIIEHHGKPKRIRTDNGPEFCSKRFQLWLRKNEIEWSRIQKGKPQQNAIIERFNKTYREDVLDANVFSTLQHARELTTKWLWDYNNERLHQSLNYQTPIAYAA